MRGRYPVGPEYVDKLQGSAVAKERAKAVLETINGTLRLQEACQLLGVSEQRFHQVRQDAVQAAVTALEPGLPGRPAQQPSPDEELIRALQAEVVGLQLELRAAKAREEIALTLPRLLRAPDLPEAGAKKKRRGRPRQPSRPPPSQPPGPRSNT